MQNVNKRKLFVTLTSEKKNIDTKIKKTCSGENDRYVMTELQFIGNITVQNCCVFNNMTSSIYNTIIARSSRTTWQAYHHCGRFLTLFSVTDASCREKILSKNCRRLGHHN